MKKFKPIFNINFAVEERLAYLKEQLKTYETMEKIMPEGNLTVAPGSTDNAYRYYVRNSPKDKQGIYLNKLQNELKKNLATKKYIKLLIRNIRMEINKLEKVHNLDIKDSIVETYKSLNPGITRLITPVNIDDEAFVAAWKCESYVGLGFDLNDKTSYYSDRGERMRSKSELLIANTLNKLHIPYKYECPIEYRPGKYLYPDFSILDVKSRQVIYWEHLGRMGDISYVTKNLWKLDEYKKNGIYLGINLFITYEYDTKTLGTDEINMVINKIFAVQASVRKGLSI